MHLQKKESKHQKPPTRFTQLLTKHKALRGSYIQKKESKHQKPPTRFTQSLTKYKALRGSYIQKTDRGFTLIEMLVAVSILVILGGTSYFVFKTAVDVYHRTATKTLAAQRSRVALDKLVNDLRHIQVSPEEPEFALYTQDMPMESGDRDILSFVTLVNTDPDPFLLQLAAESVGTHSISMSPLVSDVQRVAYFLGNEIPLGETALPTRTEQSSEQQTEALVLYRVTTTALDPQLVIGNLLETGDAPETDENGEPISSQFASLISGIVSFDLKYFDGEETWYDSWDETESTPLAVQILISVQGEDADLSSPQTASTLQEGENVTQPGMMTQSTMVHLPGAAAN